MAGHLVSSCGERNKQVEQYRRMLPEGKRLGGYLARHLDEHEDLFHADTQVHVLT